MAAKIAPSSLLRGSARVKLGFAPYVGRVFFPPFFFFRARVRSRNLSRYETPIAYFGSGTDVAFKRCLNSNEDINMTYQFQHNDSRLKNIFKESIKKKKNLSFLKDVINL